MKKRWVGMMVIALLLTAITVPYGSAGLFKGGISGKVTTSDGEAVSGCTVTATRGEKNFITTTDVKGDFTMEVPPGRYDLKYTFNKKTHTYGSVIVTGGLTAPVNIEVPVEAEITRVKPKGQAAPQPPGEISLPGRNAQLNVSGNRIINYSTGGTKIIKSMDTGANITVGAKTGVKTEFQSANLSISAHDNTNGILKFKAEKDTKVKLNLSANAVVGDESEKKVSIKADNVETTVMIAGPGSLDVENNTIKANLRESSQLISKSYPGGKEKGDDEIESGIVNGNISAEVQIFNETEGTTNDTVEYSPTVTIKEIKATKGEISVTADSKTEAGTTIAIIVENSMLPAEVNNLSIKVDGEATVNASSFYELYATRKEDKPRSMVIKGDTCTKILVAVNHFSERAISIESKEVPTAEEIAEEIAVPSPTTPAPEEIPGFEALTAIAIILAVYHLSGGVKMRSKRR